MLLKKSLFKIFTYLPRQKPTATQKSCKKMFINGFQLLQILPSKNFTTGFTIELSFMLLGSLSPAQLLPLSSFSGGWPKQAC